MSFIYFATFLNFNGCTKRDFLKLCLINSFLAPKTAEKFNLKNVWLSSSL